MVKSMSDARQQLLTLLSQQSFRLGQFKLSSGGTSDYYIDCRTTTLHAEGARLTGRVFLDEIERRQLASAGHRRTHHGSRPHRCLRRHAERARTRLRSTGVIADAADGWIHGFLVRKSEKTHGTGQRVEGFREKGARVVIVDDVCTTGASTVQAIEAATEFGFEILGVMCLVEREEAQGRAAVESAAGKVPFVSIFTASEVRAEHLRHLV